MKTFKAYHPREDTWDDHSHGLQKQLEAYLIDEEGYLCIFTGSQGSIQVWDEKRIFRGEGTLSIEAINSGYQARNHRVYAEDFPDSVLEEVKSIYRRNRFLVEDLKLE